MAVKFNDPSEDKLSALWHQACEDYAKETGLAFSDEGFPKLGGPEDLSRQLEHEEDSFEDFRMKKRSLLHAMQVVIAPFENWGDIIAGAAAASFPPASVITGAILLMVRGARRVSDAFNMLIDLFHKLGNFALRLESYKGVPLSEGIKTIIVKVLVNYLRVCAASQSILTKGSLRVRLSKWAKNVLLEDESVSSLLSELEELTSQEHMMVSAHGLKLTHQAVRNTEELLERDNRKSDRERLERVKTALNPISASGQVFSSISENRIPGSGRWIEDKFRSWWQRSQPLLWLHGGPGVGKSHLASKLIGDLSHLEPSATPPVVGSFFFKNNDVDLRSLNNALRTLAWQVATQKTSFALHAEELALTEDPENTYMVWRKLLLDYFNSASSNSSSACLVIDAIDEAEPEEQEILFSLLEKAFHPDDDTLHSPPLRIVLISRDSVGALIEEHSLDWIPDIEVGNEQNKDDLHEYVAEKLQKTKLFRGSPEFREEIVTEISREAEGLWEWANLVIKSVLRCRTKDQIRKVVKAMPQGISAMLHQELQRLSRESGIEQLSLLLSFVTLAQKPLAITQLDLMLEIILKEEVLNLADDIRTVYSSLLATRSNKDENPFDDSDVVTLRHSSFYEFFRTNQDTENKTPGSLRPTRDLWDYAKQFLPLYMSHAKPEGTGELRTEISSRLEDLLTQEESIRWFVENQQVREMDKYAFYPTAQLSNLGSYWIDTESPEIANERAQQVLQWLLPETQTAFYDFARSSEVASDACPFTVVFSRMVVLWSQQWLNPDNIKEADGWPAIFPAMLIAYHKMATGTSEYEEDPSLVQIPYRIPSRVLRAAELQALPQTSMWHARHQESPRFSRQSLHVIHRDMARTFTELGKHKEALEHFQLAEPLKPEVEEWDEIDEQHRIIGLLTTAQMQHLAKLTQDAIATANEAWEFVLSNEHLWWGPDLFSFFEIFLELHQPHRLCSVWDFASTHFQKLFERVGPSEDFRGFLASNLTFRPRIMYRVFHYVLTRDDQNSLDMIAGFMGNLDTLTREWGQPAVLNYLLGTILYEKGQVGLGLHGWYETVTRSDADEHWNASYCRPRDEDIPPFDRQLLTLDKHDEYGDLCLVISSWLRDHGNAAHARDALRGRVKQCIALLSDNDPSNDSDAFISLFKTFLQSPDSREDLSAVLHLVKLGDERLLGAYDTEEHSTEALEDNELNDLTQALTRTSVVNGEDTDANDINPVEIWFVTAPLTECSVCKREISSIHFWYFCRSCPLKALCRRCHRELDLPRLDTSDCPGVCNPQHEFYYTGPLLAPTERVPEGMVPLVSSSGERNVIWIEEWKERLAKKWETDDFVFKGGLSAWCMRVLPEPQRSRWTSLFST
ncbi:hypothetical protein BDV12DRAFT_189645 [Aspergillus spectabilis]